MDGKEHWNGWVGDGACRYPLVHAVGYGIWVTINMHLRIDKCVLQHSRQGCLGYLTEELMLLQAPSGFLA